MKNKFTVGDVGEIMSISAGGIGGIAAIIVAGLSVGGFLMKHADENYHQRKLTQQREEMDAEIAYLIRQETKRQQAIERQYYENKNRNQHQNRRY